MKRILLLGLLSGCAPKHTIVTCEPGFFSGEVDVAFVDDFSGATRIWLKDGTELTYPTSVKCSIREIY